MNFFIKNLKTERENYVKQFKVNSDVIIEPCDKFVACLNKLTKNYVLALKDNGTETLQIARHNDIEFFEGYELTPNYTDSVRKNMCKQVKNLYFTILELIESLNILENQLHDKKDIVNDIKLNTSVICSIVLNIYQHLTMTNDIPHRDNNHSLPSDLKELLQYIKLLIIDAIDYLNNLASSTIIDYISNTLDNIINNLLNYYNKIIA